MRENHIKKCSKGFRNIGVLFYKRMIYHFKNILFRKTMPTPHITKAIAAPISKACI